MKKSVLIFALLILLLPTISFATVPYWGPFLSCSGAPGPGSTLPKCTNVCDILATGKNILDFGISTLFFIIAPLLFVYGGILIMVSGANPGLHSKGVSTIKTGVIAVLVVMAAYIIVNTFVVSLGINKTGQTFIQGFTGKLECSVSNKLQSP